MLIPFGILSSAAGITPPPIPPVDSEYQLIESQILSVAASEITFSSLATYSSTFRHLQIRYTAKNSSSATGINVRFNGETGSIYSRHHTRGNGSATASAAVASQTSIPMLEAMANSTTADVFAAGVLDILDAYSTTKNTTLKAMYGNQINPAGVYLTSGLIQSTSAIGSITLTTSANDFIAGSRFSLYGLEG
jgi:hypothetical protein